MILAIDHVGIAVTDLQAAVERYRSVLGVEPSHRERVDEQAAAFNDLVRAGDVRTTLGAAYRYEETGAVHQLMGEGGLPEGNVAILVGAPEPGTRDLSAG